MCNAQAWASALINHACVFLGSFSTLDSRAAEVFLDIYYVRCCHAPLVKANAREHLTTRVLPSAYRKANRVDFVAAGMRTCASALQEYLRALAVRCGTSAEAAMSSFNQ